MKRATKQTSKPAKPKAPEYPRVHESFNDPAYMLKNYTSSVPSVGNGMVDIRRYRITVELIDEPKEVLADRLLKLWRSTRNFHEFDSMKREAAKYGIDLNSAEFGADVKRAQ